VGYVVSKENFNIKISSRVLPNCAMWAFFYSCKGCKQHQWHHVQGEVHSLHKLDKHYYGLFGFMLMNEKVSDQLTKYPEACE